MSILSVFYFRLCVGVFVCGVRVCGVFVLFYLEQNLNGYKIIGRAYTENC